MVISTSALLKLVRYIIIYIISNITSLITNLDTEYEHKADRLSTGSLDAERQTRQLINYQFFTVKYDPSRFPITDFPCPRRMLQPLGYRNGSTTLKHDNNKSILKSYSECDGVKIYHLNLDLSNNFENKFKKQWSGKLLIMHYIYDVIYWGKLKPMIHTSISIYFSQFLQKGDVISDDESDDHVVQTTQDKKQLEVN